MTRHLPEQARREQILAAARRCFVENGFHPTRMDEIARTAGLSKGGVYFHFSSKQEVFETLVEEEYSRSMSFLRGVAESEVTTADKMRRLAEYYLDYFGQAPDAPRFFVVMGEMALRDPSLAERLRQMQGAYIEALERLLEQGVAEGVLRPIDSRVVAALLKALIDGVEGLHALAFPVDLPSYLGVGLDLVMSGLGKRE